MKYKQIRLSSEEILLIERLQAAYEEEGLQISFSNIARKLLKMGLDAEIKELNYAREI